MYESRAHALVDTISGTRVCCPHPIPEQTTRGLEPSRIHSCCHSGCFSFFLVAKGVRLVEKPHADGKASSPFRILPGPPSYGTCNDGARCCPHAMLCRNPKGDVVPAHLAFCCSARCNNLFMYPIDVPVDELAHGGNSLIVARPFLALARPRKRGSSIITPPSARP